MTVQTETRVRAAVWPSVNLLPPELEQERRFRKLQVAMGFAVLVAGGCVAAGYMWAHSGVATAQQQLAAAQSQQAVLNGELSKLQNVSAVDAQVASDKNLLGTAMGNEIQWSHYLTDLSLFIPDNVWLTNVTATESAPTSGSSSATVAGGVMPTGIGQIQFTGVAFTHDDVATWLQALAKERGFEDPYFSSSTESQLDKHTVVDFTSTVTLTSRALSHRYAAGS
jgi:Tfp pilus assembly protein PilN